VSQPEISPSPGAASKRLRPKTYVLAVYITLAVALIQVVVLGSIFWLRHKVKIDTRSPAPAFGHDLVPAPSPAPGTAAATVPAAPASAPITLQPTLGAARLPVPVDTVQEIAELDQKAYGYMQQGEYDLAWVALLQAENIDSRHLLTLRYEAELAEAGADWNRAATYWQRIIDLGSDAGDFASIASSRLAAARAHLMAATLSAAQATVSPPVVPAKPAGPANSVAVSHPAPSPSASPAAPIPAVSTPPPASSSPPPAVPSPAPTGAPVSSMANAGSAFHVSPTERVPLTGNAALAGFTLRLPIVPTNAALAIDPGKVGIKLFFYDQIQGGVIVPTNAHLEVAFESPRVTWLNGRSEVLRAVYQRPADAAPGAQSYYGYVFRLYYDGSLVEERSDPPSLLSLFPASP